MAITRVTCVNGKEKEYDADAASLEDHERLFVLYKWTGRKHRRSCVLQANQVVRALLPSGKIIAGRGTLEKVEE